MTSQKTTSDTTQVHCDDGANKPCIKPCALSFSRIHSFLLWVTLTAAFILCFMRRLTVSTWSDVLSKDFHADAAAFGSISGAYWYAYAVVQIPAGIVFDVFGRSDLVISSRDVS